jgi:hypothetical protein
VEPEKTPRKRAEDPLIRLLVPDWRPTPRQGLWAIRIGIVLGLLVAIGYSYGITLWDRIKLLVVPAAIAAAGLWFNRQQQERQQADDQRQQERALEIGTQRTQDEALQTYLDDMGQLLLDKDRPLRQSKKGDEVRILAQARTTTILPRLDGGRRGRILQFLYTSDLIARENPELLLDRVFLAELIYRGAYLKGANLAGANLILADLGPAEWATAYVPETPYQVYRTETTNLEGANLERATLAGAILQYANLRSAYMLGANLTGANLLGADLTGAHVTEEQLAQVKVLEQATMPNGQKYEDWLGTPEGQEWFNTYKKGREEDGENNSPS